MTSKKSTQFVLPNNVVFALSPNDPANLIVKNFIHYTHISPPDSELTLFDEEDINLTNENRMKFKVNISDTDPIKKFKFASKRVYRIVGYPPGSIPSQEKVNEGCKREIRRGYCTFNFTKKEFMKQKFYRCYTCNLEVNLGICEICKEKCHTNHHTVFTGILDCYCDCGDQNPKLKKKCCCLRVINKPIKPTIPKENNTFFSFPKNEVVSSTISSEESLEDDSSMITSYRLTNGNDEIIQQTNLRERIDGSIVLVKWNFDPRESLEANEDIRHYLFLKKGDRIEIIKKNQSSGWWYGKKLKDDENKKKRGYFPKNFVEEEQPIISSSSSSVSNGDNNNNTVTAIFDYDPRTGLESGEDISLYLFLKKGDLIQIIKRNQIGWWYGKQLKNNKKGYFPNNYVK